MPAAMVGQRLTAALDPRLIGMDQQRVLVDRRVLLEARWHRRGRSPRRQRNAQQAERTGREKDAGNRYW
jgi:hypothetical protein